MPLGEVSFTEVVDSRAGRIRGSGHLTAQGADLVAGSVRALRERGHEAVLLDLADLHGADAAGLAILRDLRTTVARHGGSLVVLSQPATAFDGDRG